MGAGFKLNESLGAEFAVASDLDPGAPAAAARAPADHRYGLPAATAGKDVVNAPASDRQNQGRQGGGAGGGSQGGFGVANGAVAEDMVDSRRGRGEGEPRYYWDFDADVAKKGVAANTAWFRPTQLGLNDGRPAVAAGQSQVSAGNLVVTAGEELRRGAEVTQAEVSRADAKQLGDVPQLAQPVDGHAVALQPSPSPVPTDGPAPVKPAPANEQEAAPSPPATTTTTRKIIRNGAVEFEVDRFDSAFAQVVKLVQEAGGYVGTTDSEKLPNGKVKGTVTVRVPPERLDTLVLQLRGIGDLKSQKLEAQDVSKKYSDLDSELRAARAMEERLLAIIKEGKGQIKDLLAAEKELGNWRTKIETITGELRYFDNLVAMSTLNITMLERNIATVAAAIETETIDAGVESEDVEKARADALKAIEEAKGRVIQSDLKRYDAGQFGATIVAEVPPDRAGALLDRIRQIGKVARLDVQRKQSTPENASSSSGATNPPVRVEKRDTRLNLSLYNLANVAPRQTTALNLAADDVEQAYRAILERVAKAGGRIVTSNIARNKPEQTTAAISFEIPAAQADAVAQEVRALGEAMKLTVTENPDVQNVTTAKRGYNVSLVSSASITPRETQTMQLAAEDVRAARDKILAAAEAGGARILASQLNETDPQHATAKLDLDVKRTALAAVEKALAEAGQTINRQSSRSTDTENTLDSKIRLTLTVAPADQLPPRETTVMSVELRDVESAMGSLQATAASVGGRVVESNLSKDREGRSQAKVVVEVPLEKAGEMVRSARDLGAVRAIEANKNLQVPSGPLSRARIDVIFGNAEAIVAPERGLWASIRRGLSTSLAGLAWSVQLIVIGLCFVLPWVLILWAVWKLIKRRTRATPVATT